MPKRSIVGSRIVSRRCQTESFRDGSGRDTVDRKVSFGK